MVPNSSLEIEGLRIHAIPSYNPAKQFHPRERNYVGYVVEMNGTTYFVAGDTDRTTENEQVVCDVALLPCGGKYTMDAEEAAGLANRIKPKLAIPTHYGTVVGQASDAERFEKLVDASIAVRRDI